MAIDGIGIKSSFIGNGLLNVRSQLEDLQQQRTRKTRIPSRPFQGRPPAASS